MQVDDPPSLSVGTAVSAKYKGAFCEAKVSKVVRQVKCKVTYKMGLGTATVSDEQVQGTLRVGQTVKVKHPEKKELLEATIGKIQDCSQYTVVFDDGDITTLRRTALCLKSGRHFNESETLDQLPLTHPEHFGNPVVGGRRGRRNRQLKDDSSDGEGEEKNEPDLEGYCPDVGRVVTVEAADKKRNKDNWFPGLVVIPSAQPTVRINVKDEYLVRSFKDDRYYTVPKKEVTEFNREIAEKVESPVLAEAVAKVLKYLDQDELPAHWEKNSLFSTENMDSDSEPSDDEPTEEKDRFVAQLYKFMDDSGTPLNKSPMIGDKDVDLHRLFKAVYKLGGYNRVTTQKKWKSVTNHLRLPDNQFTYNQVMDVYKKCLLSYESFHRTLGVTMFNHTRPSKKNQGRSLIRDKDRVTPVNTSSPKPDKDEESTDKKDEDRSLESEKKKKPDVIKEDDKRKKDIENSDTNSSDATDQSETPGTSRDIGRPKRMDKSKERKGKSIEKVKVVEKSVDKKEEEEKMQQTRSKTQTSKSTKEAPPPDRKKDFKVIDKPTPSNKTPKKNEDEKKRGKKKTTGEEKSGSDSNTESSSSSQQVNIGDKLKVYYGPTHESKVTYEAKVIEIDRDTSGTVYLVHYTGWNTRYDEWISPGRIAENLSATTKAKRLKQNASASMSVQPSSSSSSGGGNGTPTSSKQQAGTSKAAAKRGRGMSITGRSTAVVEAPRSTTPSSITSSSSRTKSPATPATRSTSRITRQEGRKTRRSSAQTDISNHSDSDSENSESETDLSRTRSGVKLEEVELKTYKKKNPRMLMPSKSEKTKDKEDTDAEREDDPERSKRMRKIKKSSEKEDESDEENSVNPPKGRDFDLNQIRSELKGFAKAIKVPLEATDDKEALSSSDESSTVPNAKTESLEEKREKCLDQSPNFDDDVYEFKEPEPFEFESRPKLVDDKASKKRITRIFEDIDKSPKRKFIKSPDKSDKDSPEPERKKFKRTPVRKQEDSDDDEKRDEDPFDKLVESPSFNLVKSAEKVPENKQKVVRNLLEEESSLFRELPETVDDYSQDMELSDTESQTRPIFSREEDIFSFGFTKPSPDPTSIDVEASIKDAIKKDNLDFDAIRESIARKIERSPSSEDSNDDSNDLMITPSVSSYQNKKREVDIKSPLLLTSAGETPKAETQIAPKIEIKEETCVKSPTTRHISPALQETDSSLLESICSSQPISIAAKLEETREISLKTGTKIADSILQKFNSLKNNPEASPKRDSDNENGSKKDSDKSDDRLGIKPMIDASKVELKTKPSESEIKKPVPTTKCDLASDTKKRRKVVSRPFIDESDADSSDSEQLVIARSDEDSQTNSLDKPDLKESDSNFSAVHIGTTDDSQSQEEERNFKFDKIEKSPSPLTLKPEPETLKEEEPDNHLHSLLLCEETLPRSPAPATEGPSVPEQRSKTKGVLEMPFASAPGSSNSKNMLLVGEHKPLNKPQPPPLVLPIDNRDASVVLDNTPPTTPESTTSNLSPHGEHGNLSPNTIENESGKSNDGEPDFGRKRRNSGMNKVSMFSEEDTQMTSTSGTTKRLRDDFAPAGCRKRRKSARTSDDPPARRGRKPMNRSRHNSDSDDTSEHSITGSTSNVGPTTFERATRPPRPSKYNFYVEFDPALNSGQRIAVLQQKLTELRKTYAEVKSELAAIERRKKKIKRREREALKAAKQEASAT